MQINPYFIYPMLEAPILFIAFSNISKIKFGLKKALLAMLFIYTAIMLLSVYIFPHHFLTGIVGSVAYISIISLIANSIVKNLPLCIFYAVLSNIVFLLAGNVTGATLAAVIESYDPGNRLWWFAFVALAIPLTYFVSYIFGIFLKKRIKDLEDGIKKKLAIYMLAVASMTLAYFQIHSYVRNLLQPELMGLVYALSLALHFIILAYVVVTFAEKFQKDVEINHHKEMLDNLQSYTKNIEELTLEVKKFIHDHKNLMLGFYDHIENEDITSIRKFFNDYMHSFSENITSQNTCPNPPPVSLIFEKGYTTKQNGEGLGLYTASTLVNENDKLFLSTHIDELCFTQKLIISNE